MILSNIPNAVREPYSNMVLSVLDQLWKTEDHLDVCLVVFPENDRKDRAPFASLEMWKT
jgi:hypothetical protein